MEVTIEIGDKGWQFLEKDKNGTCEVINLNTKEQYEGFITTMKSNGTYVVKLGEKIEFTRKQ